MRRRHTLQLDDGKAHFHLCRHCDFAHTCSEICIHQETLPSTTLRHCARCRRRTPHGIQWVGEPGHPIIPRKPFTLTNADTGEVRYDGTSTVKIEVNGTTHVVKFDAGSGRARCPNCGSPTDTLNTDLRCQRCA